MFRYAVLILVVVEDGLVLVFVVYVIINIAYVLILIVLEDGLVLSIPQWLAAGVVVS